MRNHAVVVGVIVSLIGVIGLLVVKPTSQPDSARISNPLSSDTPIVKEPVRTASKAAQSIQAEVTSPPAPFDMNKTYIAILHTEKGDITIALNAKATPKTVENFVTLARRKFYDGTIFHRVIAGFMIQGGDPRGDGTGGPGYRFADEPFAGEYTRGTVAMANSGPDTNGSQFFIMHADTPIPKNYVIFARVTKGIEVVYAIATAPVIPSPSGEASMPVNPVRVKSVEIEEKQ